MPEPPPSFETLLQILHAANVRYVLVGGLAVVAHGAALVTRDLDISYERTPKNLAALAQALTRLRGALPDVPFRLDARTLQMGANFTFVTDGGDIDLLGDAAGIQSFEDLWNDALEMELYGVPVPVASLAHLITMKRAAGRAKDQQHLMELEGLVRLQADESIHQAE